MSSTAVTNSMRGVRALRSLALLLLAAPLALAAGTALAQGAAPKVPPTLQKVRDTGVITLAHRESSIRDLKLPGLRVEYLAVTPAQRIPSIVDGKADLECGNTTNTAARRKQAAFTVTHYFAGGRLLVRADAGIRRLAEMRGKTIVVNAGSTHAAFVARAQEKGLFSGRVVEAKDADAAFAELEAGRADAYLHDDIVLFALRANSKEPRQWEVVGEFTTVEPLAIMLRRDDPEFKKFVDLVLQFVFPTDKVGDEIGG